jgi:hypothetical protein
VKRLLLLASMFACGPSPRAEAPSHAAQPVTTMRAPEPVRALERTDFNRQALLSALPLFWREDTNNNGALDPDELAVYWAPTLSQATLPDYVREGAFTENYARVLATMANRKSAPADAPAKETARLAAVEEELAQSATTLVYTDLRAAPEAEKQMVALVLEAAALVEQLHARKRGTREIKRFSDSVSTALLFRNQTPLCLISEDANCRASLAPAAELGRALPARGPGTVALCETVKTEPFRTVVGTEVVPYAVAYQAEMTAISERLAKAAAVLQGSAESTFVAYLDAAARAFRDDTWFAADEAWLKVASSKYALRVAPDERRDEAADPCGTTLAFHLSFGVVNQAATRWHNKLDLLEMEKAIAAQIGAFYRARKVMRRPAMFVDVALRAGDARYPFGAPLQQSFPRIGAAVTEGRSRAVVTTNSDRDTDSRREQQRVAESVFCADTIKQLAEDPEVESLRFALREAATSLGPAGKDAGKSKTDVSGEPLNGVLEALQAQTTSLFLADWLAERKELERDRVNRLLARALFWDLSFPSRSAYRSDAPSSAQVAAIEFGLLFKDKAITWNPSDLAANATDRGCYSIDIIKVPAATRRLLRTVGSIRSRGDKSAALALLAEFSPKGEHMARITERMQRAAKQSFVYSVRVK